MACWSTARTSARGVRCPWGDYLLARGLANRRPLGRRRLLGGCRLRGRARRVIGHRDQLGGIRRRRIGDHRALEVAQRPRRHGAILARGGPVGRLPGGGGGPLGDLPGWGRGTMGHLPGRRGGSANDLPGSGDLAGRILVLKWLDGTIPAAASGAAVAAVSTPATAAARSAGPVAAPVTRVAAVGRLAVEVAPVELAASGATASSPAETAEQPGERPAARPARAVAVAARAAGATSAWVAARVARRIARRVAARITGVDADVAARPTHVARRAALVAVRPVAAVRRVADRTEGSQRATEKRPHLTATARRGQHGGDQADPQCVLVHPDDLSGWLWGTPRAQPPPPAPPKLVPDADLDGPLTNGYRPENPQNRENQHN